MHFGLPVIGADRGGSSELICDGENGLIFRGGDAVDMAAKIRKLASSSELRRRLGNAGSKLSKKANYSADVGIQFSRIICDLIR